MLHIKCLYIYICIYGYTKDRALPLFPFYIILDLYLIYIFNIFSYYKQQSFVSSSIFLRILKYLCFL